jgi:hypothetical protein
MPGRVTGSNFRKALHTSRHIALDDLKVDPDNEILLERDKRPNRARPEKSFVSDQKSQCGISCMVRRLVVLQNSFSRKELLFVDQ